MGLNTSVVRQTDCNLFSRARALTTFARMSEARAVQMNAHDLNSASHSSSGSLIPAVAMRAILSAWA